jgi:hypothetical protein
MKTRVILIIIIATMLVAAAPMPPECPAPSPVMWSEYYITAAPFGLWATGVDRWGERYWFGRDVAQSVVVGHWHYIDGDVVVMYTSPLPDGGEPMPEPALRGGGAG